MIHAIKRQHLSFEAEQRLSNVPFAQPMKQELGVVCLTIFALFQKCNQLKHLRWKFMAPDLALGLGALFLFRFEDSMADEVTKHFQASSTHLTVLFRVDNFVAWLQSLIEWLMGAPGGLKLNKPLNTALGKLFISHLALWRSLHLCFKILRSIETVLLDFMSVVAPTAIQKAQSIRAALHRFRRDHDSTGNELRDSIKPNMYAQTVGRQADVKSVVAFLQADNAITKQTPFFDVQTVSLLFE
ncbi:hypothetical protein M513_03307 [Trichuris suis]|uniref:Uncharacterized protein n=1 Tax=Trichuris suis TaxID=68888 RepID=A0A085MF72_9BILA|nr:hypothetical protein M513_03307 [Trichuris suis]